MSRLDEETVGDLIDGGLDRPARGRLAEELRNDPQAMAELLDHLLIAAQLRALGRHDGVAVGGRVRRLIKAQRNTNRFRLTRAVRSKLTPRQPRRRLTGARVLRLSLAAAAVLLVALGLHVWRSESERASLTLAVTTVESGELHAIRGAVRVGGQVPPGSNWTASTAHLRSPDRSSLELTAAAGALSMDGTWRLDQGRLLATVTPQGRDGFRLATPHARFGVLGTVFSVQTDSAFSQLEVLRGVVRAEARGGAHDVSAGMIWRSDRGPGWIFAGGMETPAVWQPHGVTAGTRGAAGLALLRPDQPSQANGWFAGGGGIRTLPCRLPVEVEATWTGVASDPGVLPALQVLDLDGAELIFAGVRGDGRVHVGWGEILFAEHRGTTKSSFSLRVRVTRDMLHLASTGIDLPVQPPTPFPERVLLQIGGHVRDTVPVGQWGTLARAVVWQVP